MIGELTSIEHVFLLVVAFECVTLTAFDMRRFEIDLMSAFRLFAVTLAVSALTSQAMLTATLLGAAASAAVFLITRLIKRGALGLGDLYLYGAAGAVAGVYHLPVLLIAAAVLGGVVSHSYALARGKSYLFSAYPAALAFGPAMMIAAFIRLEGGDLHAAALLSALIPF